MGQYKLEDGEQWEEDAFLHPPHFCPNCGESLDKPVIFWNDCHRPRTEENPYKQIGYDCYCPRCHWIGDILPAEDMEIVEKITGPSIPYKNLSEKHE